MMDIYEQHLLEEHGLSVFKKDYGFISYRIEGDQCFGKELYVVPEERHKGKGLELARDFEKKMFDEGVTMITLDVITRDKAPSRFNRLLLGYCMSGYVVIEAKDGKIVLAKILKEEGENV